MTIERQVLAHGAYLITSKRARLAGYLLRQHRGGLAWIQIWRG
jgi:hypothetical protein